MNFKYKLNLSECVSVLRVACKMVTVTYPVQPWYNAPTGNKIRNTTNYFQLPSVTSTSFHWLDIMKFLIQWNVTWTNYWDEETFWSPTETQLHSMQINFCLTNLTSTNRFCSTTAFLPGHFIRLNRYRLQFWSQIFTLRIVWWVVGAMLALY